MWPQSETQGPADDWARVRDGDSRMMGSMMATMMGPILCCGELCLRCEEKRWLDQVDALEVSILSTVHNGPFSVYH